VSGTAHLGQEAGADLAEVRLLLVVLALQLAQEQPLEAVDVLDVAEDGVQLGLREHGGVLATLPDVPLEGRRDQRLIIVVENVEKVRVIFWGTLF